LVPVAKTCKGVHHADLEKDNDNLPSVAQVKASIATALGAAAVNAKLLADQEEREMEQCMSDIIENQVGAIFYLLYTSWDAFKPTFAQSVSYIIVGCVFPLLLPFSVQERLDAYSFQGG
jgi:hypothetical protein